MEIAQGLTPVDLAVSRLGIVDLAHACRVTTSAVHKWADRGGLIPAPHQAAVLKLAREKGVELEAADLIPGQPARQSSPASAQEAGA